MTNDRRIQIASPSVGEEEWRAAREPLESGWLTQGPKVAAFEEAFAARHGVTHAIAVTSCTAALHLAVEALGIGPGDEVMVPSFTWIATANVVVHAGATPVLVDVDRETYNIDPKEAEQRVTPRTRAVMAVHMFGLCADVPGLRQVLPTDVAIIEDAACAVGAALGDRSAGALGEVACFSFHPRKTITTGEGGMVTTNDTSLADRASVLRNHGASISEEARHVGPKPYLLPSFDFAGFNYRMTDIQAAIGLVQLGKLDRLLDERDAWAQYYRRELADISWLRTPPVPETGRHGWQAFVCYIDPDEAPMSRNEIMEVLQSKGISTRAGTHAVHTLSFYQDRFGLEDDDLPVARDCAENTLAIPLHNRMSERDYEYVVATLRTLGA
ncbi:MAG: DegT/DnrJ/EryC1/StrS family aminotransferase [Actinomycetota bacterium]|nr:DegT/DnrJ/EryC1/StrS family aminotransferase [Actinomycetota bacterium]